MLESLLSTGAFSFMLVFARIGSAMMLLPGFGEAYVAPRVRLGIALALSVALAPLVSASMPALPGSAVRLFVFLGGEIAVGLFIGTITRLFLLALETAGAVIAFQTSMANAMVSDPATAQQASIVSTFLMSLGLVLIFVTNLHYLMLRALVDSYQLFKPGALPPIGDMADMVARVVSGSFLLSVQIAAPFILSGLVLYIGLGLLGRLMPQLQIFFIIVPLQVAFGLLVLLLTVSAGIMFFLERFTGNLSQFVANG